MPKKPSKWIQTTIRALIHSARKPNLKWKVLKANENSRVLWVWIGNNWLHYAFAGIHLKENQFKRCYTSFLCVCVCVTLIWVASRQRSYPNNKIGVQQLSINLILMSFRLVWFQFQIHYFIKWKNYPYEQNTWEPVWNLSCEELIQEYEENHPEPVQSKVDKMPKKRKIEKKKVSNSKWMNFNYVKWHENCLNRLHLYEWSFLSPFTVHFCSFLFISNCIWFAAHNIITANVWTGFWSPYLESHKMNWC